MFERVMEKYHFNIKIIPAFFKMKSEYCLKSVTSFADVNKNPLNTSISKNLWSFAKDERFKKSKVYCENIYNISGIAPSKYGVSIGKGNKSDFTKNTAASAASMTHFARSFIDDNIAKKKGVLIGVGRDVN
jgi:hypothetical protein